MLFRKPLDNETELVVIRGPDRRPADLARVIPQAYLSQFKAAFSVRVELHLSASPPVPLATRLVLEQAIPGFGFGGFEVLDLLVDPGQVVLATAESGGVVLWRIELLRFGRTEAIRLRGGDWTMVSAIVPLDKTMVRVKLRRTESGLVEAEVTDLQTHFKQQTRFIQVGKDWRFRPAPRK